MFIGSWKTETIGMFLHFFMSQLDVDGVALQSACSVPFGYIEVSPIPFEDSCLLWKFAFFEVSPVDFFEYPSFTQVRREHSVFVLIIDGNKFIQEPEKFFNLLFREICIVLCVFDFESVHVRVFSCHYVWQGVKAWVANWNTHGVVPVFLQKFYEGVFGVEASLSPSANGVFVNLPH